MAVDKILIAVLQTNLKRLDGNPVTAETLTDLAVIDLHRSITVDRIREALIEMRNRAIVHSSIDMWNEEIWTLTEKGKML
jgi:hypothetical protein